MNLTKELDRAIKLEETKSIEGAYVLFHNQGTVARDTYMTREEWDVFLTAMKPQAAAEFRAGGGDELSEKNGRPPKMASYGSSSRLLYRLTCEKEGFHYEKKLPTTVGGVANLDGFWEEEHRYGLVEAKCHEPYAAKRTTVSVCYRELYEWINRQMAGSLRIEMKPREGERLMDVCYYAEEEKLEHFDLKQMICHLLGIATGILKGTLEKKQIDFIYLLYDPTELPLPEEVKGEIDAIYEKTCEECNRIDFARLLQVIVAYLRETRYSDAITDEEIEALFWSFTFTLASQEFFPLLI